MKNKNNFFIKKILITVFCFYINNATAEDKYLDTKTYYDINSKALQEHIIPSYEKFSTNMIKWHNSVEKLCKNPTNTQLSQTKQDFKYIAMGFSSVMNIGFGSITYFDTYKKIDFWPDKKSFINRGLKKILKNKDRKLFEKIRKGTATPVVISFNSSERLLFKTNDSVIKDSYACNLLLEQANYFKKRAFDVLKDWKSSDGYRNIFLSDNLSDKDAHIYSTGELYKASMLGLQLIADKMIGEPLSKQKKRGRPYFAQYPYSRTSKIALQGVYDSSRNLILNIFKDIIVSENKQKNYTRLVKLFDKGQVYIDKLDGDIYTLAKTEQGRKKLEKLQNMIILIRTVSLRELNLALNIPLGFNGLDGD